jgi:hypothetical protein
VCKSYIQIRSDDTRNAFPSSCDNGSVSSVLLCCCCCVCVCVLRDCDEMLEGAEKMESF